MVLSDVNEVADSLCSRPTDDDGVQLLSSSPVLSDQLLRFIDTERQVVFQTTLCRIVDFSPVGRLVIISNQAHHCRVFSLLDY